VERFRLPPTAPQLWRTSRPIFPLATSDKSRLGLASEAALQKLLELLHLLFAIREVLYRDLGVCPVFPYARAVTTLRNKYWKTLLCLTSS
jgi:hypothetical protein